MIKNSQMMLENAIGYETLTKALKEELENDEWDADYCCNYSPDGTKLLDAENFPDEVKVREGTRIICDDVFSFKDYMAPETPYGQEIQEEDRASFLDKIYLPRSVEHIGNDTFRECGWLGSIKLPVSLISIGDRAFKDCWGLKGISCPASLVSIGAHAFEYCFSLKHARLDKKLERIGKGAFYGCDELEEIRIPKGTWKKFKTMIPASLRNSIIEL
ncbi:MAG: leucine-rich repeat domain-containing protein [Bacteroidales bacterium]|jgi:hypothetical protein|nr:leucine-rich repeat domain-containing protein [Bacteroidales bacterium]